MFKKNQAIKPSICHLQCILAWLIYLCPTHPHTEAVSVHIFWLPPNSPRRGRLVKEAWHMRSFLCSPQNLGYEDSTAAISQEYSSSSSPLVATNERARRHEHKQRYHSALTHCQERVRRRLSKCEIRTMSVSARAIASREADACGHVKSKPEALVLSLSLSLSNSRPRTAANGKKDNQKRM